MEAGPLDQNIQDAIVEGDLIVSSVLKRNFEGRFNYIKSNFWHLIGCCLCDCWFNSNRLGKDVIATVKTVTMSTYVTSGKQKKFSTSSVVDQPEMFRSKYADVANEPRWNAIAVEKSDLYPWSDKSTHSIAILL